MKNQLSISFIAAIILLMLVLGALVGLYLPWYSMGISAALISFLFGFTGKQGFFIGFTGGFILWAIGAGWFALLQPSALPVRMASVLPLQGNLVYLYLVTGVIGGLTSGLWAWAGAKLRLNL